MSKKIKLYSTTRGLGSVTDVDKIDESRTIDLVWTTGFKGLRTTRDGFQYYEELAVDTQAIDTSRMVGNPLLASHDTENLDSIIGVIESVSIDPARNEGRAKVRFAKDEYSERVFQKVKDGIIRNTSVGYKIDFNHFRDISKKEDTIPTFRAERWTPYEISLVGVGFDPYSNVRSEEPTEEFEIQNTETITENPAPTNNEPELPQTQEVRQMSDADQKAQELAIKKQAAVEEKQRQLEIRQAVRGAKLEESFADELITQDVSADQARKQVLEKLASQQPKPIQPATSIEFGKDETDKKREAAVNAILSRVDSSFKPSEGNGFNHQSLLRIMESFVGYRPGMSQAELATRAMSSSDLPYILANVAEKSAQQKYQNQPRTWSRWASKESLRNFKTHDKVRSGDFASLEERQEGSEFKRGSFSEEREQVALKEFGKVMSFSRRMLINDDLSEIQKVASQGGSAAARLENRLVYEVLTSNPDMGDGVDLFHADHGNLEASGAALSDTTIGSAFQKMREQLSVDGLEKLNLSPKYLICGPQNEVLARKYLAQISPTQASNVNVFSNSLELIVDAEISTNDYFFAADQNLIPTVTLFYLEGEENPRIESRTDFETESVEIKCAHSCVAKAQDWRGLVKNPNAS